MQVPQSSPAVVGRRLPRTSRALLLTGSQGPAFLPCCPRAGVGKRMKSGLILAILLLGQAQASPGKKKQFQVLPAIPTQIEQPPEGVQNDEASDEDDDDDEEANIQGDEGWDVDYIVNRPTSAPDVDDDDDDCKRNYEEEGEGDKDCVKAGEDLTPYKKYKSYKRWERRPLFVIIIGGWVDIIESPQD